jgi:molybdopterin molybdotransferase
MAALAGAVGFVQPLLARMAGTAAARPLCAYASLELRRKAGGAKGSPCERGALISAERIGPYGSGKLAHLLQASGFLHILASARDVHAGHAIDVIPFETRGLPPLAS